MSLAANPRFARYVSRLASAAAVASALSASGPADALPVPQGVELRGAVGVSVRGFPGGTPTPASPHMQLGSGAVVSTAGQSAELVWPDGTTVALEANSSVQLQPPSEVMLSAGGASRVTRLDLRSGWIRVRVGTRARPFLVLAGRQDFAVFRSGLGRVRLAPDGMTTVVEEGQGMVTSGGRWAAIPAGSYLTIGRKPTSGIRQLPAAPEFPSEDCEANERHSCAIAVTLDDAPATVAARWLPLPEGHLPLLTLSSDPRGERVITSHMGEASMTEFAASLAPGSYWLTVRAIGPDGVQGRPATHPLRVVRLLGDEDTKPVESGRAALLFAGRRLTVDDPSDLVIGEPGGFAVHDPGNLVLRGRELRRALRFGLASNPRQHAWFTLVRRLRTADVTISPGKAVWPRDPVELSVELHDSAGPVTGSAPAPEFQLVVNGVSEKIDLARAGSRWVGRIAPRRGVGPWTIRAGVFDGDGIRIGHGVLDVIAEPAPPAAKGTLSGASDGHPHARAQLVRGR